MGRDSRSPEPRRGGRLAQAKARTRSRNGTGGQCDFRGAKGWICPGPPFRIELAPLGDVAQLGERRVRNAKVGSSILLVSTNT